MASIDSSHSEDHIAAHKRSSIHRQSLLESELCGCFHCCEIYSPEIIGEWVDKDDTGLGQTAMCPKCGIDSVIAVCGDRAESTDLLKRMQRHWF